MYVRLFISLPVYLFPFMGGGAASFCVNISSPMDSVSLFPVKMPFWDNKDEIEELKNVLDDQEESIK